MEEAKDIRELKSLLSDLSLQDNAQKTPSGRKDSGGDAYAQKIALLKSVSILLFSLSLFLMLCLTFVLVRGYLTDGAYRENNEKTAAAPVLKEAPVSIKPAPMLSEQTVTSPPVSPSVPHEQAAAEKPPARTAVLKEGGGSLYFIALKNYGKADETLFDFIMQSNPGIMDVRKIDDLHKITLPDITAESYIAKTTENTYRVHIGTFDTADWAKLHAARAKVTGKTIAIEPYRVSSQDTWYRLMIGDFASKEEALQIVGSLAKRRLIYIPPQVR